jgi:glycosyltransferase involved in cell wall biosynthesis
MQQYHSSHIEARLNYTTPDRWNHTRTNQHTIALIPAFNEARFIGSVVLVAKQHVDEVVVVDDGSDDQTAEIAQHAGATVIRHLTNHGKAAAVNTGFQYVRECGAQAVVMLDGDGQHNAKEIPAVLAPILAGNADIVIGSRFLDIKSEIPAYRQVGQHGLTLMTNLMSGVASSDSQSGFRAFSVRSLDSLQFSKGGFSLESEMQFLIRDHSLRVAEVPIQVFYREPAKRSPVRHGMQVVNSILQLVGQTRPLLFFGLCGVTVLLLGLALGIYMIQIYSRTHELAIGYGLITVILCVMGVLIMFAGVLLHSTRGMLLDLQKNILKRQNPDEMAITTTIHMAGEHQHTDDRALHAIQGR